MALEEGRVESQNPFFKNLDLKKEKNFFSLQFFFGGGKGVIFFRAISLESMVVPFHEIVINLPGTYEKLPC